MFFRRFFCKSTARSIDDRSPLVRLWKGDFTHDFYPDDRAMPARIDQHDEQLNLRFRTREPAEV